MSFQTEARADLTGKKRYNENRELLVTGTEQRPEGENIMNISTVPYAVSVFRRGCTVKTKGTAELPAGVSHVKIEGLSAGADASSVRLLLGEAVHGSNVQVSWPDEEEEKARFAEIDRKIARNAAKLDACALQEKLWKENTVFSGSERFDLKMLEEYADAIPSRLEKIFCEKQELEQEKENLLEERRKLEQGNARPYAEADIECAEACVCPVELEYYDPRASWDPSYEIRAEEEDQPLTVRLRANIRQTTGMDWKELNLSLFTGTPGVTAAIPEFRPIRLQFAEPPKALFKARGPMMMSAMAKGAGNMAMEDTAMMAVAEVQEETADAEVHETMREYVLKGTRTILSGHSDEHADLNVRKLSCRYHAVTLPGMSDSAYLAAEVKSEDIQDLLDCTASLYLKGTYTGETTIRPDLGKETYDLSLGRDETIRVKRVETKKYTSNVLLKGQLKTEYEYEIQAVSMKPKACQMTIIDQIPVSSDKAIIVEPGNLSGAKADAETGEVRWEFELKPQENVTRTLGYTVYRPKDKQITEVSAPVAGRTFCKTCGAPLHNLKFCPECGSPA